MQWYFDNTSPQVREFIEGAIAFIAPVMIESLARSLDQGVDISPKMLLLLCMSSLTAYIRTRPTKH